MTTLTWVLGRGGLLGKSIVAALRNRRQDEYIPPRPLRWSRMEDLRQDIAVAVKEFAAMRTGKDWRIVWAAGVGTMGSTAQDLAGEEAALGHLLQCLSQESSLSSARGTIVFASSAGAIYAGSKDDLITEDSAPAPVNAYGQSKLLQENLLKVYAENHPATSLLLARLTNVYGPAQSASKRQGLISHIARSILQRRPINIFVSLDTMRDYIAADDAGTAMLEAADTLREGTTVMKIIAAEEATTIARIIGTFTSITRLPPKVSTSASPLSSSYIHRMCFRSKVAPRTEKRTLLHVGIAEVLAAERLALMGR